MKRIILFSVLSLSFFGCSQKTSPTTTVNSVPEEKTEPVTIVTATVPVIDIGMSIYSKNCGNCHVLHKPEDFTADQWNQILPSMFAKAKLDSSHQKLVRNFVLSGKG